MTESRKMAWIARNTHRKIRFFLREAARRLPSVGEPVAKSVPVLRYFRVFSAEQADWPEAKAAKYLPKAQAEVKLAELSEPQAVFDAYIANGGPAVRNAPQNRLTTTGTPTGSRCPSSRSSRPQAATGRPCCMRLDTLLGTRAG
jgi:hypothetical protein